MIMSLNVLIFNVRNHHHELLIDTFQIFKKQEVEFFMYVRDEDNIIDIDSLTASASSEGSISC